jgi:hypothetical protein
VNVSSSSFWWNAKIAIRSREGGKYFQPNPSSFDASDVKNVEWGLKAYSYISVCERRKIVNLMLKHGVCKQFTSVIYASIFDFLFPFIFFRHFSLSYMLLPHCNISSDTHICLKTLFMIWCTLGIHLGSCLKTIFFMICQRGCSGCM